MSLTAAGHAEDETLELSVSINGHSSDKIGEFVEDGNSLRAKPSELTDIGLRTPASVAAGSDGLVSLSAIPGLTARVDWPTQTLYIVAGNDLLMPNVLQANSQETEPYHVESGTGATLNYDVVGNYASSKAAASGSFDMRAFSPWGVASTSVLAYAGDVPSGSSPAVRLDSSYAYSDVDTMRRYIVGDYINGALSWIRSVRMGGAQIESDFSMRPDLVTFPLPTVIGQTAVPSTVDVLVNNSQVLSQQTAPGPFEVPQLPVVNGANSITTTVTNVLGQQVSTTLPFYASSDLLAPGLRSYSVDAGFVRKNWGLISDDYGHFATSATYRQGLSPDITAELHAEATQGQFMVGSGIVANLFDFGVGNVSLAGSSAEGRTGSQVSMGAQRTGQVFSFGFSATFADRMFRDIAAMTGDPLPRRQLNANVGLSLSRFGSLGLAYAAVDTPALHGPAHALPATLDLTVPLAPTATPTPASEGNLLFQPSQHAHVLSASYSVQIDNMSFFASGIHDCVHDGDNAIMVGLTIPLGPRSSASADVGAGGGGTHVDVQAEQSAVNVGDWGYQAYANTGNGNHEFAQGVYKSQWGTASAGVDNFAGSTTLRGEAQGAVSTADGGVFASNPIHDSFAVVDTDGTPGVHVSYENRPVGTTDADGKILVPDLRSFDVNHVSIDPADVPVSDTVSGATRDVRPQDRSGIVVRFPIHRSNGAIVRLLDSAGHPMPAGSSATLAATGTMVPVGYDGETYVESLHPGANSLQVSAPDGSRCVAHFDYQSEPGNIPTIGPVQCQANAS